MKLPRNLLSGNYCKPRLFLCETDKTKICQLETTNTNGSFKFNSLSELSFDVSRVYNDIITGETKVNPFYDKIESPRLVYLEGFAYFELQGPDLDSDGIKEIKSCTAYSLEYTLSTKYLEDFNINTGKIDSLEVLNADDPDNITPIRLYNQNNTKLSLLHLVLEKAYGWKIGYVDASLQTLSRQFEVDRESIYDFIMNEICEKFNCYAVFDTITNTINLYAESLTAKFIGDGKASIFTISPPFNQIGTVSVDGYKTTKWQYDAATGTLVLEDVPAEGVHIEVVDGALTEWETDVFVTFDNLAQTIDISYDAESIKTVLTVTYGDDLNIRETNMGLPYLTDISYYYSVDWMGKDLYDAYTAYLQKCNESQSVYTGNALKMLEIANQISFEENRLSLEYSIAQSVNETTVGTYYVRGGTAPNYYYTEVSLPDDYEVNTIYYSTKTTNLNENKVSNLYEMLKKYFNNEEDWKDSELIESFAFMEQNTLPALYEKLEIITVDRVKSDEASGAINSFLAEMWGQLGKTPLKALYYEPYKQVQIANIEAGWSQEDSDNYGYYYPVTLYLGSIENAMAERDSKINTYQVQYNAKQQENIRISNELVMDTFFTDYFTAICNGDMITAQLYKDNALIRLNAFMREDKLHLDDIIETDLTTVNESYQLKQDAMESGRIELQKLCEPQLKFSMTMANIYAIQEFEPIINQFQLGKVVKVGLRKDYIKQSRLLQVDLNFDDLSDFSCEFGDLTNLRTQSDIHADLLKQAVQAGKSVATNAGYWTRGSEQANSIDLRLQEGLLGSIEALKAIDGTQNAYIDKYGIHLEVINPDTGEVGDKRVWMVNNQIVFTDDGFKTSKSVLGEFTVDGETYYGLLAQAVIAGFIEGSQIKGGTIQIGLQSDGTYAFEVHSDGSVTMNGSNAINGYATNQDLQEVKEFVQEINDSKMYRIEILTEDSTIISTANDKATLVCKVYSWDTDITDTLDASVFSWKRTSSNQSLDGIWNAMPEHRGVKSITIDADDVVDNSSFICEVDLPE